MRGPDEVCSCCKYPYKPDWPGCPVCKCIFTHSAPVAECHMTREEWRDHEVCCSGGCGRVLEDRFGATVRPVFLRFLNTTPDGTPITMMLCGECATKHDNESAT